MRARMNLTIHLRTHFNARFKPNCYIRFNNLPLEDLVGIQKNDLLLEYNNLLVQDINTLHITHYGKNPKATEVVDNKVVSDVAIEVDTIKIDGITISKNYLWTQCFFPNWSYPPHPKDPIVNNRYLGFNGTWQLVFPKDYKNFIASHYIENKFK